MTDQLGVAFHELCESDYPLLLEFEAVETGQVVERITITGPGVVRIPPLASEHGPVRLVMTTSDGAVIIQEPPGADDDSVD